MRDDDREVDLGRTAREKQKMKDGLRRLLDEKFASGNCIPVERVTITRSEYEAAVARAAGLADREKRGADLTTLIKDFIEATDNLLEAQQRKNWTSGYAKEMTDGQRIATGHRWSQARAALDAALSAQEGKR